MPQPAFAARYGAEPGEIEKVVAFALGHGLRVDETNAARRTVVVSGTVGQFNKAFNVTLHDYEHQVRRSPRSAPQIEAYRGYDGFIHVPNDLAEIIVGVFGLDNRRITKRTAADPPSTSPIPMSTMPGLYDFPSNLPAGQTIAIFSEEGVLASDITANSVPAHPRCSAFRWTHRTMVSPTSKRRRTYSSQPRWRPVRRSLSISPPTRSRAGSI